MYISSPALFEHGVQYPQAHLWSKRCIAIQARFLLTEAEFWELHVAQENPDAYDWLGAFSQALASKPAELPTFEEVKAIEAELAEQEAGIEISVEDREMKAVDCWSGSEEEGQMEGP